MISLIFFIKYKRIPKKHIKYFKYSQSITIVSSRAPLLKRYFKDHLCNTFLGHKSQLRLHGNISIPPISSIISLTIGMS